MMRVGERFVRGLIPRVQKCTAQTPPALHHMIKYVDDDDAYSIVYDSRMRIHRDDIF